MNRREVEQRCREIALARAQLFQEQAANRYQRLREAASRASGAVSEEEMESAWTTLELSRLDVEECEVRLQLQEHED